jgi:SAM-dependent methyltransferase
MPFGKSYFEGSGSHYVCYTFEYHVLGPWRKNYINFLKLVRKFVKRGNFLDVGCAKGFLLHFADKFGFKTFGIDVSRYAIKEARKYTKARLVCQDAQKPFPFRDNFFDVVVSIETVEHLKNPKKTFKEIFRVLKPNGFFIFTTPNKYSFRRILGIFLPRFKDKDVTHVSILSKKSWAKMLNEAGCCSEHTFRIERLINNHIVGKEKLKKLFKVDIDKILPFGHDGFIFISRAIKPSTSSTCELSK